MKSNIISLAFFVGEFTLSVIAANWRLHTKLLVIRARFALFHLAALHCGESEAFCFSYPWEYFHPHKPVML